MGLRRPLETLFRARRRRCLWLQSSSLPGHVAELTHKLARVVWNHWHEPASLRGWVGVVFEKTDPGSGSGS